MLFIFTRNMFCMLQAPSSATQEGSSSAGGSQEVSSTPPAKRKLGSSRALERSDTSFSSVDISDLTNFDEEKNRTPTPPPTLEKAALSSKVLSSSHTSSPSVKTGKNKVRPTVSTRRAWEENSSPGVTRSLSEKDRVSSEKDRVSSAVHDGRLPEVDEQGQKSPVIKQLHPAYLEIPYIVATNGHYSTFAYLFRSKSVPDIVLGTDTSDNLDCKAGPPPGPISAGSRGRRDRRSSRRSFQTSNDLSLAQKVLLARRVEMYLAAQQSQVKCRVGGASPKHLCFLGVSKANPPKRLMFADMGQTTNVYFCSEGDERNNICNGFNSLSKQASCWPSSFRNTFRNSNASKGLE